MARGVRFHGSDAWRNSYDTKLCFLIECKNNKFKLGSKIRLRSKFLYTSD